MSDFYIKQVIATGSGKSDSIIDFKPGLNIIQGRSDTGKTCIIKCIDYCFGAKEKPFDLSLGYDTITLKAQSSHGSIEITRSFGRNQVEVITDVPGYESGTYDLQPNSKKKHPLPILSDLLLAAIGIDGEHKVIMNKDYERKRLTWRTFLHSMLFHVIDIAKETSIIEPDQATEKTAFLSSLLFLISGNDFSEIDAQSEQKLRKAKKKAVEDYVNRKISAIADRRKELETSLAVFDGIDVEQAMQETIDSLQEIENQISESVKESQGLLKQIVELQSKAAECELLRSRYGALRTQYVSDIKRLSLIVDGEVTLKDIPSNHICPFCEGELKPKSRQTYIDSAQAELSRITAQLDGLTETESDVANELQDISKSLDELNGKRNSIEDLISKELQPKADAFRNSMNAYRAYIQIQNEIDVFGNIASSYESDLRDLPSEDESKPQFHPKEHFDKEFQERMDKLVKDALTECCYENLTSARFNMQNFDVEVNGHKKNQIHGQGYCSFLNSIIAFVFRQYLSSYAVFDPGFLVIDTPLLALDQGVEDIDPESIRTALFRFFANHQDQGQVIILENLKHMPEIDLSSTGANIITFTKGYTPGRYGFLNDVKAK